LRKGDDANPTVVARADFLRQDVWNRWRAGEGLVPPGSDPLTQAISKLADVADRQLQVMTAVEPPPPTTIHSTAPAPRATRTVDRSPVAAGMPTDPPLVPAAPVASAAPLFSLIDDEYIAMGTDAGAAGGTLSTMGLRAWIFRELAGNKPFDTYLPKDLQDYVNLLQYVPVEYIRASKEHEALQHMLLRRFVDRNKQYKCWV